MDGGDGVRVGGPGEARPGDGLPRDERSSVTVQPRHDQRPALRSQLTARPTFLCVFGSSFLRVLCCSCALESKAATSERPSKRDWRRKQTVPAAAIVSKESVRRIKARSSRYLLRILEGFSSVFPLLLFSLGEACCREFVDRERGHGGSRGDAGGEAARVRRGGRRRRRRRRRHGQAQLRDFLHPREQVPLRIHGPAPALAAAQAAAAVRGCGLGWQGGAAREGVRAVRGRRRGRAAGAARRPRAGAPRGRAPARLGQSRRPRRGLLRPRGWYGRGRRLRGHALLHALARRPAVPRRGHVAPGGGPRAGALPEARGLHLPLLPRQEAPPGRADRGAQRGHEGGVRPGAHPARHHKARAHLLLRPQVVRAAPLLARRRPREPELRLPPLRGRPRGMVGARPLRAGRGGVGGRRHLLRRGRRRADDGQPGRRRHHPRAAQQARVPVRARRRGPPRSLHRRLLRHRRLRGRRHRAHAPVGSQGVGPSHRADRGRRRRRPRGPRRGARLRAMPLLQLPAHSGETGEHAAVRAGRGVRPDADKRAGAARGGRRDDEAAQRRVGALRG